MPNLRGLPRLLLNLRGHLRPVVIDVEKYRNNDGQDGNDEDQRDHDDEGYLLQFGHGRAPELPGS